VREAVRAVRARTGLEVRVALLGGGEAGLWSAVESEVLLPAAELPIFSPPASAGSDESDGRLVLGRLEGVPVVGFLGLHRAVPADEARVRASLVRLMRLLGPLEGAPPVLLLRDSCWALNPLWDVGDVAIVDDHINLMGENPLTGVNLDALGPRFPDMSRAYDPALQELASKEGLEARIPARRGVYVGVAGPGPGTRAECRMLRRMGADVVGTSLVGDVIVARHMGMPVLALAQVAKHALSDTTAGRGSRGAGSASPEAASRMDRIVRGVVARLARGTPPTLDP